MKQAYLFMVKAFLISCFFMSLHGDKPYSLNEHFSFRDEYNRSSYSALSSAEKWHINGINDFLERCGMSKLSEAYVVSDSSFPNLSAGVKKICREMGVSSSVDLIIVPRWANAVAREDCNSSRKMVALGAPLLSSFSDEVILGLIAHEIGHLCQASGELKFLLQAPLGACAVVPLCLSGMTFKDAGKLVGKAMLYDHFRWAERDADKRAAYCLVTAAGLKKYLESQGGRGIASQASSGEGFFSRLKNQLVTLASSDHPELSERIDFLDKRIIELNR
jgi:Zn-dependent protease with chaperone function